MFRNESLMDLTIDNKKLAYLVAKLPLRAREFEGHIKDLLKILHREKKEYEAEGEDPEHNLWELSLLISYFETVMSALNSVSVRLYIKELKGSWGSAINHF